MFSESLLLGARKTAKYGEGHFGAGLHKSGFMLFINQ